MPRRILEGDVVSDKTDKTITVLVERRYMHPIYKKYLKKTSKFAAHDEANQYKTGDRVRIIECRPISKTKRWTVMNGDEAAASAPATKPATKKEAAKKAAPKPAAPKVEVKAKDEKPKTAKKPAAKKTTTKKAEKKDK